eukprot:CAMPEP_0174837260 /NCGR_PEP_ID=MMETSP1114-20130205/6620_1 /TAXON_ID=312471 /ORGANISM="Neobodo designis, Strain CCAP 1951/1" /LENGTH=99 /DNA_ID=CAMNT_0016071309 /DNA_START=596 /DNA_END=891 /DNA_ORIENTATION=+
MTSLQIHRRHSFEEENSCACDASNGPVSCGFPSVGDGGDASPRKHDSERRAPSSGGFVAGGTGENRRSPLMGSEVTPQRRIGTEDCASRTSCGRTNPAP